MIEQNHGVYDADIDFLPSRLNAAFINNALSQPEVLAGDGAPPYFQYALSLDSEFRDRAAQVFEEGNTLTEREYDEYIESHNFMLVHALVRADDYLRTKVLLPTVQLPQHKVALFEAALLLKNMAGAEVLASYDMGNTLEAELQQKQDFVSLATVMMLKITAGIDVYTSASKLESLLGLASRYSIDFSVGRRMVNELTARGDVTLALQFAKYYNFDREAELLEYLWQKDRLPAEELEPLIQRLAKDYQTGKNAKAVKVLKKATLTFDGKLWNSERLAELRAFGARAQQDVDAVIAMLQPNKQADYMIANPTQRVQRNLEFLISEAQCTYRDAKKVQEMMPKDDDATALAAFFDTRLLSYTYPLNTFGPVEHMHLARVLYGIACELIAYNTPTGGTYRESLAGIYGRLAVLEAKRQPSVEHYQKNDFYSRATSEQEDRLVLDTAIRVAKDIASPIEQHEAFQRIISCAEGGWTDLQSQREEAEHLLELSAKQLQHPLLKSIIGI